MRGPNRAYSCTSGPNGTQCRYCALRRIRKLNELRRAKGQPEIPTPNLAAQTQPCQCKPCRDNQKRAWDRYELRHGLVQSDDGDLDRKALDNWNPEWGARA